MKKKLLTGSFVFLSCFSASALTQADNIKLASLDQISGKVLVNKGKGFVTAKSGMPLSDNDRVITLNDSSATVVYSDGCVASLKSNNLLTLDKGLTCSKAAVTTQRVEQPLRYAAAIGGTATDVPATAGPGGTAGGFLAGNGVVLTTVAVIGGMVIYDAISDD